MKSCLLTSKRIPNLETISWGTASSPHEFEVTRVIKSFSQTVPKFFDTRQPLERKRIHAGYPSQYLDRFGEFGWSEPCRLETIGTSFSSWCIRAKPETFVDFSLRWKRRRFVRKHLASPSSYDSSQIRPFSFFLHLRPPPSSSISPCCATTSAQGVFDFFWREGGGIMDTRLIVSLLFNWIRIGFEMHRNFVIFLLFKENLNLKVVRYFVKLIIIVYKYLYNSLIFFVLEFGLYNLLCKFFRQSLQFFIVS